MATQESSNSSRPDRYTIDGKVYSKTFEVTRTFEGHEVKRVRQGLGEKALGNVLRLFGKNGVNRRDFHTVNTAIGVSELASSESGGYTPNSIRSGVVVDSDFNDEVARIRGNVERGGTVHIQRLTDKQIDARDSARARDERQEHAAKIADLQKQARWY